MTEQLFGDDRHAADIGYALFLDEAQGELGRPEAHHYNPCPAHHLRKDRVERAAYVKERYGEKMDGLRRFERILRNGGLALHPCAPGIAEPGMTDAVGAGAVIQENAF